MTYMENVMKFHAQNNKQGNWHYPNIPSCMHGQHYTESLSLGDTHGLKVVVSSMCNIAIS